MANAETLACADSSFCDTLCFDKGEDPNADTQERQEYGNKRRSLLNKAEIQIKQKKKKTKEQDKKIIIN